jgi:hypothetical protein
MLVTVTVAPGMIAEELSLTTPCMAALNCAPAGNEVSMNAAAKAAQRSTDDNVRIRNLRNLHFTI